MAKQNLKTFNMPWSIVAIPALICVAWGYLNGLKTKKNARYKREPKLD